MQILLFLFSNLLLKTFLSKIAKFKYVATIFSIIINVLTKKMIAIIFNQEFSVNKLMFSSMQFLITIFLLRIFNLLIKKN